MTKALPALAVLQEIFALLFSNRWIARWQQSQLPPARSAEPRASGRAKKNRRCAGNFTSASSRCG